MEFFGGLIFGPWIFLGFVGSPRDFLGVLIFAPIRSSRSLEIRSTLLGFVVHTKAYQKLFIPLVILRSQLKALSSRTVGNKAFMWSLLDAKVSLMLLFLQFLI